MVPQYLAKVSKSFRKATKWALWSYCFYIHTHNIALQSKMVQKKSFSSALENLSEMSNSEWVFTALRKNGKQTEPTHSGLWCMMGSGFAAAAVRAGSDTFPAHSFTCRLRPRETSAVFLGLICEPLGKSRPCPIFVTLCGSVMILLLLTHSG